MPSKNTVREYVKDGVYHIYNRGINKQDIFQDAKDYTMFLFYLKLYLDSPENLEDLDPQKRKSLDRRNFCDNVDLLCYCLMPNHFHIIIKQKNENDISEFMRSAILNYSMYFNRRHKRVGPLFQGKYKAILVKTDDYLLHLSRYIHLNPFIDTLKKTVKVRNLDNSVVGDYQYSSYANYLGKKNTQWVKTNFILEYFNENKNDPLINKDFYKNFVESYTIDSVEIIGDLALE